MKSRKKFSPAVIAVPALLAVTTAQQKPNLLRIVSDGCGYGDMGAYGRGPVRGVATPDLGRFAAETRFAEFRFLLCCAALLSIVLLLRASFAQAAEPEEPSEHSASEEELVKQTQNPVADLISLPFQNNFNFEAGPKHNHQIYLLNIQPVIPIHVTENWNVITRIITPVINLPSLAPGVGSAAGLGDINPTFFLSPAKSGELIWGAGPTFTLPTASDKLLGNHKFSLGPAAVGLMMTEHWVYGALINNQWSVAGWGGGHVNQLLVQPFVNYNLPDHWYLVSAPIMTANWAAARAGDVWTVPLGGGVGKLFRLGQVLPLEGHEIAKLPINTQIQFFGNVARPDDGAKWQMRFQFQFLFPK